MRLIDADNAIKQVDEVLGISDNNALVPVGIIKAIMRQVLELDSITPTIEPKRGRWIYQKGFEIDETVYIGRYQCDRCNHFIDLGNDKNYCPNCGAKMERGVTNETD